MLYVNDLPYASKFETTLFADDANLHLSHNNIDSLQTQAEHETILGPLLFLLYVNDLPNVSKFETTLFADDTSLHLAHHDFNLLQQPVEEIDKIENWVTSNKLTINYNKSSYMIISGNKKKIDTNEFNVSICGNVIAKSDCQVSWSIFRRSSVVENTYG